MSRIQTTIGIFQVLFLTTLSGTSGHAAKAWASETAELPPATADLEPTDRPHLDQLLNESQISYRADGGFTKVESYSVIVSCVKSHVSVMTTIEDPRLPTNRQLRKIGHMPVERYVALWNSLDKQNVFWLTDGPKPKEDIMDEFTVHFNAKVGDRANTFNVADICRPDAARYFALRQLIDKAVNMSALWNEHQDLVKALSVDTTSKN